MAAGLIAASATTVASAGGGTDPVVESPDWFATQSFEIANGFSARYDPTTGRIWYGRRGEGTGFGLYEATEASPGSLVYEVDNIAGIAVDDDGDVFVALDFPGVIRRLPADGGPIATWVSGFHSGDDDPVGLEIAPRGLPSLVSYADGEAYVADRGNNGPDEVWRWSTLAEEGEVAAHADDGTLVNPVDVAVGVTGVWIADAQSTASATESIYRLEDDGSVTPVPLDEAIIAVGIDVDPASGDLLVADAAADRVVHVVPGSGAVTTLVSGFNNLSWACLDVGPGGTPLVVTDRSGDPTGAVHVFHRTRAPLIGDIDAPVTADDDFGWDVSMFPDSGFVAVGAQKDGVNGFEAGAVYITSPGSSFNIVVRPDDASIEDRFGRTVEAFRRADGGRSVAIGAPWHDGAGVDSGAIYLYDFEADELAGPFVGPDAGEDDELGQAIAFAGGKLYVGAPGRTIDGIAGRGAVDVFDAESGTYLQTVLPGSSDGWGFQAQFGRALDACDGRLVVAAPFGDLGGLDFAGWVEVYDLDPVHYVGRLKDSEPLATASFGWEVAVSPTRIAMASIAIPYDGLIQAGRIVLADASTLDTIRVIPSPAPQQEGFFGRSLALAGPLLAVGEGTGEGGVSEDRVWVYDATDGTVVARLTPEDVAGPNGFSIDARDDIVIVGRVGVDRIDRWDGFVRAPEGAIANPTPAPDDRFGASVAVSPNTIVIGAPGDDTFGAFSGAAYLADRATGDVYAILEPGPGASGGFGASVVFAAGAAWVTGAGPNAEISVFDLPSGALRYHIEAPLGTFFGDQLAADDEGDFVTVGAGYAGDATFVIDAFTGTIVEEVEVGPFLQTDAVAIGSGMVVRTNREFEFCDPGDRGYATVHRQSDGEIVFSLEECDDQVTFGAGVAIDRRWGIVTRGGPAGTESVLADVSEGTWDIVGSVPLVTPLDHEAFALSDGNVLSGRGNSAVRARINPDGSLTTIATYVGGIGETWDGYGSAVGIDCAADTVVIGAEHALDRRGMVFVETAPMGCDIPADINGDGLIDFNDLLTLLSSWGTCEGCASDLDGDGAVGFSDLLAFLAVY